MDVKRATIVIVILSLFIIIAEGSIINIVVSELISVDVVGLKYENTLTNGRPLNTSFEIFNSGSVGSKTRIRLDILENNKIIFTGWSNEVELQPGSRKYLEIYWYPFNKTGQFTGRLRAYIANEIQELKTIKINVKDFVSVEKNIEIISPKIYSDRITFLVKSDKDLENLMLIPSNYPRGWIIEQKRLNKIKGKVLNYVELEYYPSIWKQDTITIFVLTGDGKNYGYTTFELKKTSRIEEITFYMIKSIENLISKIL